MNYGENILQPIGDGERLTAEAMDRVLQSLPLDECTLEYNRLAGVAQFVAPEGKAFRITGEDMNVGRFKNSGEVQWPERSNSDHPIPEDPNSLGHHRSWDEEGGPEHIATRLTLRAGGSHFGRSHFYENDTEQWTQSPSPASSDDDVSVLLLDAPQAWTESYLVEHTWPESNHPMARIHREVFTIPQNVIGMRQAFIEGKSNKVKVELVDVEPVQSMPGVTPDGRILQVATKRECDSGVEGLKVIQHSGVNLSGKGRDDLEGWQTMSPDEAKSHLWRGRRRITGKSSLLEPYADDPLRDFELVLTDQQTGRVMTPEEAVAVAVEDNRLQGMLSPELEAELERLKHDPTTARENAKDYLEPIQHLGSLATTIKENTKGDWMMRAGQRRWSPLFGQFGRGNKLERVLAEMAQMSLDEVVATFASPTWKTDDEVNGRKLVR